MTDFASEPGLSLRVYLEDTDSGGIVYHASYLRFMERARTEWLRSVGLEQSQTFKQDVSFVVHSMTLRYLLPARLDDVLEVSCRVTRARAASIVFEQEVRRTGDAAACCSAVVTAACISLSSGRPRRIPPELLARMTG